MHLASGSGNGVSGDNSNNTNLDESQGEPVGLVLPIMTLNLKKMTLQQYKEKAKKTNRS